MECVGNVQIVRVGGSLCTMLLQKRGHDRGIKGNHARKKLSQHFWLDPRDAGGLLLAPVHTIFYKMITV